MTDISKETLVNEIKNWIALDDEISKYRKIVRDLNAKKKNTSNNLVKTMKAKNVDCFEMNSGGALIYKQTKSKKPITSKVLNDVLYKLYNNQEKVESIIQDIQDSREEVIRETICRKKV